MEHNIPSPGSVCKEGAFCVEYVAMDADRDIVVVGAGAAGLTAAAFAAAEDVNVLVVEELASGGQQILVSHLTNFPGFPQGISGVELSSRMEKQATAAGHGGGDFFTNHYFAEAIRTGTQPYLDVYRGVAMSVVGILAWKSVLDRNNSYEMPDFKSERSCARHAKDTWRPMDLDDPNAPPVSSRGKRQVVPEALKRARRVWKKLGYTGE